MESEERPAIIIMKGIRAKHYMRKMFKRRPKRCVVCDKALRPENKSGLCSKDWNKESVMNWNNQIPKKARKDGNL